LVKQVFGTNHSKFFFGCSDFNDQGVDVSDKFYQKHKLKQMVTVCAGPNST